MCRMHWPLGIFATLQIVAKNQAVRESYNENFQFFQKIVLKYDGNCNDYFGYSAFIASNYAQHSSILNAYLKRSTKQTQNIAIMVLLFVALVLPEVSDHFCQITLLQGKRQIANGNTFIRLVSPQTYLMTFIILTTQSYLRFS